MSSTLRLLVAQRLLRRLCVECKEPYQLDRESADRYEIPHDAVVYRAKGCARCRDTGYRGRVAVFEIIRINQTIRDLIQAEATVGEMQRAAVADGMKLLGQSAAVKVALGDTSLEEALSLCGQH